MIASMGEDWALRLWDARTGQDLITSVGRHRVMRFSRDGRRLSTAPSDRELAILELAPEQVFREFRSTAAAAVTPSKMVRSADGRFIVTVHPQLRFFDTARAEEIGRLNVPIAGPKQAFFENDGSAVFYSLPGNGSYRREFALDVPLQRVQACRDESVPRLSNGRTHIMNKIMHGIVLVLFGGACGFVALMLRLPQMAAYGHELPAFSRLCMVLGPILVGVLALLALAYCLWVWIRKTEGRASWVAFLATTMAALVFVLLPTMVAMYLPLVDAINRWVSK